MMKEVLVEHVETGGSHHCSTDPCDLPSETAVANPFDSEVLRTSVKNTACQTLTVKDVPQRTRRVQTRPVNMKSTSTQVHPKMVSVGVQCSILTSLPREEIDQDPADDTISVPDTMHEDPDYFPMDSNSDSEEEEEEETDTGSMKLNHDGPYEKERYFLVAESALLVLLNLCLLCGQSIVPSLKKTIGSMIVVERTCMCGWKSTWTSQRLHRSLPLGNLAIATSVFLHGLCSSRIFTMLRNTNIPMLSLTTFHRIQRCYIVPTIWKVWGIYRSWQLEERNGEDVILGGDARCGSMGHSAKYGTYSMLDLTSN